MLLSDIYDVNTGSLRSYPCNYDEVLLSDDLMKVALSTRHISTIDGDSTMARERLHGSVKQAVLFSRKKCCLMHNDLSFLWIYTK